jgi:hypothetical protein
VIAGVAAARRNSTPFGDRRPPELILGNVKNRTEPRRISMVIVATTRRVFDGNEFNDLNFAGKSASKAEAIMGQIFGIVGSGMLFLSFCAYCEAREALQSTAFNFTPARAKAAGIFAGAVTLAVGLVVCCLLVSGAPYDSSL